LAGSLTSIMLVACFAAFGFSPPSDRPRQGAVSASSVGRGLTVLNMGSMGGTFLVRRVSGL
jgi:hypothetical protein